jgi:hypothetical protein
VWGALVISRNNSAATKRRRAKITIRPEESLHQSKAEQHLISSKPESSELYTQWKGRSRELNSEAGGMGKVGRHWESGFGHHETWPFDFRNQITNEDRRHKSKTLPIRPELFFTLCHKCELSFFWVTGIYLFLSPRARNAIYIQRSHLWQC